MSVQKIPWLLFCVHVHHATVQGPQVQVCLQGWFTQFGGLDSMSWVDWSVCHRVDWPVCHWVDWTVCHWVDWPVCHWVDWPVCHWVDWTVCHWVDWPVCHWVDWTVCNWVTSLVPRPRRGRGKSSLVTNVCTCAEITKKTGNRILSVNSSYYGTVYMYVHLGPQNGASPSWMI